MRDPLSVAVCQECGCTTFPAVPLCPACGARSWELVQAMSGTVELVTCRPTDPPLVFAYVRTDLGPHVIARSSDSVQPGSRVRLTARQGGPFVEVTFDHLCDRVDHE